MLGCIRDGVLSDKLLIGRLHRFLVFGDMCVEVETVPRRIELYIRIIRRSVIKLIHEVHYINRIPLVILSTNHAKLRLTA